MEINRYLSIRLSNLPVTNRNQRLAKGKSRGFREASESIVRVGGSLLRRKLSHWDLWIGWRDLRLAVFVSADCKLFHYAFLLIFFYLCATG